MSTYSSNPAEIDVVFILSLVSRGISMLEVPRRQCESCCHSCCANYVQCHTNHCCHEQCRYECGTSNCRSNCRESCYQSLRRNQTPAKIVQPNVVYGGAPAAVQKQDSSINNNNNLRNVTTVINVKNVVNSTNFLNLPINMTSINRNNITLKELERGGGSTQDCCIVIGKY
ncbi:hypothetical protein HUJ05_007368 [Dendroctonus ponderosae]|nr:hypothetical protein HUJ05_007368 [Dendroctonus ponderosae]